MKDLRQLNRYRYSELEELMVQPGSKRRVIGAFEIPLKSKEVALVIADNGVRSPDWEHVSVSLPYRCLTWDEMCEIKDMFFNQEETVIQIHPAKKDYVNFHPYCLHLWKPKTEKLPLPPAHLVL